MSNVQQVQVSNINTLAKKQYGFIAKISLFSGVLFAIVFLASFFIANYWLINNYEAQNILTIVGTVMLFINLALSFVISFRGMKSSIGFIGLYIAFYCITFTIMFSCYFSLLGNSIMFYALAFTSIALIITSVIGFLIKPKTAYSLMKITSICFGLYFLVSICGSLLIWFLSSTAIEIWQIIVTALIGVIVIGSNIYTFYALKKTAEFANLETMESKDSTKLTMFYTLSLLSSIINTFILMIRILLMMRD